MTFSFCCEYMKVKQKCCQTKTKKKLFTQIIAKFEFWPFQKARKHTEDSDDDEDVENLPPIRDPTPAIDRKHRFFIGKDYSNAYEKDFEALDKYNEGNYFFIYVHIIDLFLIF